MKASISARYPSAWARGSTRTLAIPSGHSHGRTVVSTTALYPNSVNITERPSRRAQASRFSARRRAPARCSSSDAPARSASG